LSPPAPARPTPQSPLSVSSDTALPSSPPTAPRLSRARAVALSRLRRSLPTGPRTASSVRPYSPR
jgi:hypothetical protein